ncbi:metal cation symporter ZIP14-like [Mercenaria mercenaria]|uniref:metal cation symporter ZIP14-like n=1 Tax=Mercenaria mercenaria TaxID=6596 RepID=UPI00234F3749|nr:metal cation symporter ZIP14-like [Mercenaria mercenaria]
MAANGYVHKRIISAFILHVSLSLVNCRLIDNVNEAIISNFYDNIENNTGARTDAIGTYIKTFAKYRNHHDVQEADKLDIECAFPSNLSSCKQYLMEECLNVEKLLNHSLLESKSQTLSDWFPSLMYNLHSEVCIDKEPEPEPKHHRGRKKPSSAQAWGYGIGFVTSICCVSNVGGFMAPFMKKNFFQMLLLFCVALAVGTLAGTGFLVLIPESMHLTEEDSPVPDYHFKMATVMGGVYFFYISERLLKIWFSRPKKRKQKKVDQSVRDIVSDVVPADENDKAKASVKENGDKGHTHVLEVVVNNENTDELTELTVEETGKLQKVKRKRKLTTVALIIMIGDALHNFVDGIAIGAAFTENTYLGISVSISVICEELPHELGDIAILLSSGLNMRRSLCYNFLAALTCYVGLVIGILLGENTDANMWIFAVAGGMFVYISLVDMVPEMSDQIKQVEETNPDSKWTALFIQNIGLLTGFVIIMMLVMYGGNIKV